MSLKTEWSKFVNKIMWLWIWDSNKRKTKRISTSIIEGHNNKIIVSGKQQKNITGLNICIKGNDNTIKIDDNNKFENSNICISANNASIIIGKNSHYIGLNINMCNGNNQKLTLGDHIVTWGVIINLNETNSEVIIGNNCLFSNSISIWPTDGHSIFDKDTKERINKPTQTLEIGDTCWIGEGVRLSKNTKLPPNTIVGIGSVVTKSFTDEYTIIAGNPAKIIKRNVIWKDSPYYKFEKNN